MSKVNSFDVMKRMSAENKDIQMFPDVVSAQTAKGGGHVTVGVSAELVTAMAVGSPKYKVFLLALNEEQYNAVSAALENESKA
jgi:hypothetical protein